jgi:hypothetical protein
MYIKLYIYIYIHTRYQSRNVSANVYNERNAVLLNVKEIGRFHPFYRPRRTLGRVEV